MTSYRRDFRIPRWRALRLLCTHHLPQAEEPVRYPWDDR